MMLFHQDPRDAAFEHMGLSPCLQAVRLMQICCNADSHHWPRCTKCCSPMTKRGKPCVTIKHEKTGYPDNAADQCGAEALSSKAQVQPAPNMADWTAVTCRGDQLEGVVVKPGSS